jgi:hypothetical protein
MRPSGPAYRKGSSRWLLGSCPDVAGPSTRVGASSAGPSSAGPSGTPVWWTSPSPVSSTSVARSSSGPTAGVGAGGGPDASVGGGAPVPGPPPRFRNAQIARAAAATTRITISRIGMLTSLAGDGVGAAEGSGVGAVVGEGLGVGVGSGVGVGVGSGVGSGVGVGVGSGVGSGVGVGSAVGSGVASGVGSGVGCSERSGNVGTGGNDGRPDGSVGRPDGTGTPSQAAATRPTHASTKTIAACAAGKRRRLGGRPSGRCRGLSNGNEDSDPDLAAFGLTGQAIRCIRESPAVRPAAWPWPPRTPRR